jgi:hypothetical protein
MIDSRNYSVQEKPLSHPVLIVTFRVETCNGRHFLPPSSRIQFNNFAALRDLEDLPPNASISANS